MSALAVRGVRKGYGHLPVLRGIDLDVPEGSLTAILGSSGSGKTTLLRVIAGFEWAEDGSVAIGGRVMDDARHRVPPERRRIGYVPQEGALFPHLTVAANVAFGLGGRRARRDARVTRYLDMVGMAAYADRYPHQLSGGQQQRVALARALAIEPDLVLLDEPFSSLDASMRATMRLDVLTVLRHAATTAVLVTHDQDEALSMADEVAVLRDGRIVQTGTPSVLYTQPVDADLARFLGDANLVAGQIDGRASSATAGPRLVHTELGDLTLHEGALDGEAVPADGRVSVLLRPEQLAIDPSGNGQPAVVLSCEYYGHDAMLRVQLAAPNGEGLWVRVQGEQALPPGTHVGVAASGAVHAWPANAVASGPGEAAAPADARAVSSLAATAH